MPTPGRRRTRRGGTRAAQGCLDGPADRIRRQERHAADQHDQAERPHPQAGADTDVEDNRPEQDDRPQPRSPDERTERELPEHRNVGGQLHQPRVPGHPGHVERLILVIGEGPPHRLAVPPRLALELRDGGEEIDHAHVDVDQAERQVRRRTRPWPAGHGATAAEREPSVDRERRAAGADGQVERQHRVDLVEAEGRGRDAVGIGDRHEQGQHRGDAGPEPDREHRQHDHRGGVGRPDPTIGEQPPERVGQAALLKHRDQPGAQPAVPAEEVGEHQPPDRVRVEQHQPREDADHPQERRVGRGEPEGVPRLAHRPRGVGHVVDDRVAHPSHGNTPSSRSS